MLRYAWDSLGVLRFRVESQRGCPGLGLSPGIEAPVWDARAELEAIPSDHIRQGDGSVMRVRTITCTSACIHQVTRYVSKSVLGSGGHFNICPTKGVNRWVKQSFRAKGELVKF